MTVSTRKYARKVQGRDVGDDSGNVAESVVTNAGGRLARRELISDDPGMLKEKVEGFLAGSEDVAVFVGGTGVSPDDLTIESLRPYFERELEGFGEVLRETSYDSIGSAAMLTRATAGLSSGKLIVCLPGSPDAVLTGLRNTIGVFERVLAQART